ncbi:S16 family serine protease [Paenibacillus sp. 2TAB23]|uniref:S16 family serine protease n=1 Tax=Paenibacillus sp. 2TAB23 TaxID=3233004 RepID=UPI003F9DAED2
MRKPAVYYLFGLTAAFACLIASELIWLPAPLKTGSGMQWIEMIDWLFYFVACIPVSWAVGALLAIWEQRSEKGMILAMQLLRAAIVILSAIGTFYIVFLPEELFRLLLVTGAAVPLVYADLMISEGIERRRSANRMNGYGSRGKWPVWLPKRGGAILGVSLILLLALLCPTGYQVTYPGMTLNMNRYAHVDGGQHGGTVNGVLVFDRPAVPADWLYASILPLYSFQKTPENEPPLTETYAQVVMMKTDANSVAAAVAMKMAGIGEGLTADGVRVVAIVKDSPAEGHLMAGDIIDKLNGQAVRTISDMTGYMEQSVKPGDSVEVTLRRAGEVKREEVAAKASADQAERPVFGISVQTELLVDIPRGIDYKRFMAHIGGPSHGAMLTLAILDQLTPGGITFGNQVAGTGTIEADGSVGLIGGIKQKAYAVSRTDADVFFVPKAQEAEARSGAAELNIVPVEKLDDVVDWLKQHKK